MAGPRLRPDSRSVIGRAGSREAGLGAHEKAGGRNLGWASDAFLDLRTRECSSSSGEGVCAERGSGTGAPLPADGARARVRGRGPVQGSYPAFRLGAVGAFEARASTCTGHPPARAASLMLPDGTCRIRHIRFFRDTCKRSGRLRPYWVAEANARVQITLTARSPR